MLSSEFPVIEVCPNCGSSHPHDGPCPALQGGVAQMYATPAAEIRFDPRQEYAGKVLQNRYELLHVLGQGGMGTVFMARDLRLRGRNAEGRNCVVKKLRDDFYREEDRQKAQAFFDREMQVLSDLQHRNIVQILDYFCEGNDYYLVMEYVQGSNLHFMLHEERQGEPFSENQVIDWAIQICDVLSYLHSQQPPVIYRDLKPSNIMIDMTKGGEVKLVDFGIARSHDEKGEHTHVVSAGYSPPEQYWGAADPRSDIYSLGATMFFLLTGRDPEALHVSQPRSVMPDVSEYTDSIVQKATSQELSERFQTVEDFMEALLHKDFVPAPETPRSRVWEVVTGLILLVVAVLIWAVENMSMGVDANKPNAATAMVGGKQDNVNMDERVFNTPPGNGLGTTGGASQNSTAAQTDLAAQVMDEKDLTDPAGRPQGERKGEGFSSFGIPWLKNDNQ
jgi:serine/threonine protein kinase